MREHLKALEFKVTVTFRLARVDDIPALEWHGLFTEHRAIIAEAFRRQCKEENLMLLALHGDQPVGQCWIDLTKQGEGKTAVLWALRVVPWLQGHGIGKALVKQSEAELQRRQFTRAQLCIDKWNGKVIPFYERLGYLRIGETTDKTSFCTPTGEVRQVACEQWIYQKDLCKRLPVLSRDLLPRLNATLGVANQH